MGFRIDIWSRVYSKILNNKGLYGVDIPRVAVKYFENYWNNYKGSYNYENCSIE